MMLLPIERHDLYLEMLEDSKLKVQETIPNFVYGTRDIWGEETTPCYECEVSILYRGLPLKYSARFERDTEILLYIIDWDPEILTVSSFYEKYDMTTAPNGMLDEHNIFIGEYIGKVNRWGYTKPSELKNPMVIYHPDMKTRFEIATIAFLDTYRRYAISSCEKILEAYNND